jgi:uncharacterized protein (DUF1501 family)
MKKQTTRRDFLKQSSILAASASLYLSGCSESSASMTDTTRPASQSTSGNKALVYLVLGGGNDSFNMLVPTDNASYNTYKTSRSNLALEKNTLLPLANYKDKNGKSFGLHPSMPEVQRLFSQKKLAFIANIGPLAERTDKDAFTSNRATLPLGLLSHADQVRHWQTSLPDQRVNSGWFGRCADRMQPNRAKDQISMNISLGGTNILQTGAEAKEYAITEKGSVGLLINEQNSALDKEIFKSFNALLQRNYTDAFDRTYMDTTVEAQAQHETFKRAIDPVNVTTAFSGSELSQQFKMVAKAIAASSRLNLPKQTFFIHYYGWDHHDELLNNHANMLRIVSRALGEFDDALNALGLQDQVITFTGSDFGRSLTSNGNGTDHGWGGNVMVMGADVKGGAVYGDFPDLSLNSDLDIGGGVLIPTTSTDEMFAELAMWFGVEKERLGEILPNIGRFYDPASKEKPLGFIA